MSGSNNSQRICGNARPPPEVRAEAPNLLFDFRVGARARGAGVDLEREQHPHPDQKRSDHDATQRVEQGRFSKLTRGSRTARTAPGRIDPPVDIEIASPSADGTHSPDAGRIQAQ